MTKWPNDLMSCLPETLQTIDCLVYFINAISLLFSHSAPVPPLRTMFSKKKFCCILIVLVSIVCRQALGGQKYLIETGKKSPEKHLLVETEDSDDNDSAEGNIYCSFVKMNLLCLCSSFY